MRAATYLRVSRSDQSSKLQADETRELAQRRGWSLAMEFADEGISGSHGRRPGLQAMLAAARKRRFDVLVVYRSDRLFRSLRELVTTLDELHELGVAFVSVHESWDSTTANGRLLMQVIGAFAEFERNVLRERTRSGLEATRRRGTRLGRPRRHVDVAAARLLRSNGWSWDRIATKLGVGRATLLRTVQAERKAS
jgi:DNA invertase Pin-like site-specific DNA recombinase